MKLSVFFAATLASLCSMSIARPVDFTGDLQTRDFGDVQLSDLYSRDLSYWELLDLSTRHFTELDDLAVRDLAGELDIRGPTKPAKATKAAKPASAAPAKKLAKPKLAKSTACRKRDGACLNLFVVWYQPIGNSARHWALFLSSAANAAAIHGATGTIYQVVDHREFPHFQPEKREGIQASGAGRYENAKLLVAISKASMDEHYEGFKGYLVEEMGDHNKDRKNVMCQSNCQHWVKELADSVGGRDFSGVPP